MPQGIDLFFWTARPEAKAIDTPCIAELMSADSEAPGLISWCHSAAHCITAPEPCGGHRLGVLGRVPPPPQGLQSHRRQDQEPASGAGLQCLEGSCCTDEQGEAAVQAGAWGLCQALL